MKNVIPLRNLSLSLAAGFSLFLASGCSRGPAPASAAESESPMPVSVERVSAASEAYPIAVPGQVKATHSVVISSRIQAEIGRIPVTPGQTVSRGDLLAELLSEDLRARVRRAESELEAASLELARVENLIESRAATPREREAAEARQRSAEASLDEARAFLEYTTIRAPFDGVVTRKHVEQGDLVSPGKPILDFHSPAAFRLEAWAPESLADSLSLGDEIAFSLGTAASSGFAPVGEIRPAVDSASRTVLVKVDLPESDLWRDGQFGRLFLPGSESRRLTVPQTSIQTRGQLEYVFTVTGDPVVARLRLIRSGTPMNERVEILSGLDEGDTVVTDVPPGLRDNRTVEIR